MNPIPFFRVFIPSLIMLLVALALAFMFAVWRDVVFINISLGNLFNSLTIGAALGAGLFISLSLMVFLIRPYNSKIDEITKQLHSFFHGYNWLMITLLSLTAGIGEELLFRGLIQRYFVHMTNPIWGIVLGSLIFGLCHYLNRLYVFLAFSMGLVIGIIYHLSNDLVLVMALHAVYDFFAFTVIIKYPSLLGFNTPVQRVE